MLAYFEYRLIVFHQIDGSRSSITADKKLLSQNKVLHVEKLVTFFQLLSWYLIVS